MTGNIDTDDNLTGRAFAAYFQAGGMDQPANTSGVVECDDKLYVVLHSGNDILAVYRVRPNGLLKGLKRWPVEIDELFYR
jgi:hypothetical protein